MDQSKEQEYINKILDGETALYSYFLEEYSKPVFNLIFKIIHTQEDAEELTQDCFIKAFKKLSSFKRKSRFSTWIFRIAYNTAISATRKKKREFPVIDDFVLNNITDDEVDELLEKENKEIELNKMEKTIDSLNDEEKSMLILYYNENKSISDLSDIFEVSASNAKIKLHRIRKKLYLLLKNEYDV